MKKKSFLTIILLILTIITSVNQNQAFELAPIYKIKKIKDPRIVRDWSSISLLYPDQYHTPEELIKELQQINDTASEIVDIFTIGKSIEGRDIYCLRITNEKNELPKAGVIFIAQHHAREQITVEAVLRFTLRLVNNYGIDNEITEYVDKEEIFIIPTLNPDGLHYVVGNETLLGDSWFRKNLRSIDDDNDGQIEEDPPDDTNGDGIISEFDIIDKNTGKFVDYYLEGIDNDGDGKINEDPLGGVDLNRNYDFHWNDSTTDSGWGSDTTQEDYPGTAPFSEPETQAYRDFLENKSFASAISLHSGINATYFPWSYQPYWAEVDLYSLIRSDLQESLPPRYFGNPKNLESKNHPRAEDDIYTTAGEWGDWMYTAKDCLVPMTFEIYYNTSSDDAVELDFENDSHQIWRWDGIYEMFAPVESAINALWDVIQPAFDYWLEITPRLKLTMDSVTGGKNKSDTLKVKLTIENLSPRIRTIDELNVVNEDFDSVLNNGKPVTISEISAGKTESESFEFQLEEDLTEGMDLILHVGNDFVGYSSIIIQEDQIKAAQNVSIGVIAPLLAILTIVLIRFRKISKSRRNHFY